MSREPAYSLGENVWADPSRQSIAKERQTLPTYEATPRQGDDPDATPKRRKPLVRNDSMDFLPDVHATTDLSK